MRTTCLHLHQTPAVIQIFTYSSYLLLLPGKTPPARQQQQRRPGVSVLTLPAISGNPCPGLVTSSSRAVAGGDEFGRLAPDMQPAAGRTELLSLSEIPYTL